MVAESDQAPPLFPSQRGLLCIMMFLASLFKTHLFNIMGMQMVCMTSAQDNPFTWTVNEQKYILSANLVGSTLTMPLGGLAILKIGAKNMMAGGIFMASLMSLISPLSAQFSPYALMAAEFVKGETLYML